MSSMKFRRTCGGCNATFFATDRRAIYCPKCARKKQEQRAQTAVDTSVARPQSSQVHETASKPEKVRHKAPSARPPVKPRIPRPPKVAALTDELRVKIEAAYNQFKDSIDS